MKLTTYINCVLFLLMGCSNSAKETNIVIPQGSSSILNVRKTQYDELVNKYSFLPTDTKEEQIKKISFLYKKDILGRQIFRTIETYGVAFGGEDDSPIVIRQKACKNALRNAIEEINGVYIQSLTKVKNFKLTSDDIISQTVGIAKIKTRKIIPEFTSEGAFSINCKIVVDVPLMTIISKD